MKNFSRLGLFVPEILLPQNEIPLSQWSVIACDQYTQDREYWQNVEKAVDKKPSTLDLILPEVYLGGDDKTQRIENIRKAMEDYLSKGVFRQPVEGFIYVERTTEYGRTRKGLVVAVDLESYEWKPFSKALIRATEATIPARIPPRMEIRRGAALELPHIMLLVNDKAGLLVEACGKAVKTTENKPLYDGDLMLGAGHITGYHVTGAVLEGCLTALDQLAVENTISEGDTFLFAVGDGNHSLATAKAVWDEFKAKELEAGKTLADLENCPLRYALTEIVNLYDEGLTFEPIHRVLFNVDATALMNYCKDRLASPDLSNSDSSGQEGTCKLTEIANQDELDKLVANSSNSFGFVFLDETGKQRLYCLETGITELAVSRLQPVLDDYLATLASPNSDEEKIDYIHGSEEVFRLGAQKNAVAILLPPVAKDSFFITIGKGGPLPRKSFSMGEASEKRFYLEAKRI